MSQQIDDDNLKLAYWYNTHKDTLVRVGQVIVAVIVGLIILNLLFQTTQVVLKWSATNTSYSTITNSFIYTDNINGITSSAVIISGVVEGSTPGKVDAYALVQNNNQFYDTHFTYTFTVDGVTKESDDTVIPALSSAYVVIRDFTGTEESTLDVNLSDHAVEQINNNITIEVRFSEITLQRLKTLVNIATDTGGDQTGATEALHDEEISEETIEEDPEFVQPENTDDEVITRTDEKYTAITGETINASAIGFRELSVVGILKDSSGKVVGVHKELMRDLQSFDQRTVQLIWEKRFLIGVEGELFAYPNYLDRDIVILPGE